MDAQVAQVVAMGMHCEDRLDSSDDTAIAHSTQVLPDSLCSLILHGCIVVEMNPETSYSVSYWSNFALNKARDKGVVFFYL